MYLCNAFSLNMLDFNCVVEIKILSKEEFCRNLPHIKASFIGHEATAKLIETLCGIKVEVNRKELKLSPGDCLLVVQIKTRLPEGKVLSSEELNDLLSKNLIAFYEVRVLK